MSEFKYIGPNYRVGVTVSGGKLVFPKRWNEEQARKNVKLYPELAGFFQFPDPVETQNLASPSAPIAPQSESEKPGKNK